MAQYPAMQRRRRRRRPRVVKHCGFDLNRNTDADLTARIEEQLNRAAYLKRLIREDIERNPSGVTNQNPA